MRVCHVTSGLDARSGGPAVAVTGLVAAQRQAGLDVSVVATYSGERPTSVMDALAAAGIRAQLVGPTSGPLSRHPDLPAAVADAVEQSDIVHVHAVWEEVQHQACQSALRMRRPYVITPHGMLDAWAMNQKWLKKRIYYYWRLRNDLKGAAALHFTAQRERTLSSWKSGRALVEPLGVDLQDFGVLPVRGAFRAKWPTIADRKIIAFLGRIHPGKGVEHLLPAMKSVRTEGTLLVIAGPDSGNFGLHMRALAGSLGIADRVLFTGMLRGIDRVELLVDADLFGLPSEHENFGLVVAEAMAAGCPAIVSDEVNLCSLVVEAGAGEIVPMQPLPTLAKRLAATIDARLAAPANEVKRASIRSQALELFNWETIGRHWARHYEGVRGSGKVLSAEC